MANELPSGVVESDNSDPASLGGFAYASSIRQPFIRTSLVALNSVENPREWDTGFITATADAGEYRYINGRWLTWTLKAPISLTNFQNGFYAGSTPPAAFVRGGIVMLTGDFYRDTAPGSGLPNAVLLPTSLYPPRGTIQETKVLSWENVVQVGTNGNIAINANIARTSGLGYPINNINWPISL